MQPEEAIRIVHSIETDRYELYVGDDLAGIADYRIADGVLVFDHTETLPRYRGRGLAARLIAWALDNVRSRGLHVVPLCWFVADFIHANPEYRDLLAPERRRRAS